MNPEGTAQFRALRIGVQSGKENDKELGELKGWCALNQWGGRGGSERGVRCDNGTGCSRRRAEGWLLPSFRGEMLGAD